MDRILQFPTQTQIYQDKSIKNGSEAIKNPVLFYAVFQADYLKAIRRRMAEKKKRSKTEEDRSDKDRCTLSFPSRARLDTDTLPLQSK